MGVMPDIEQTGGAGFGDHHDIAAATAITAVRTAERLELLPMHRRATMAAVARERVQHGTIDECCHNQPTFDRRDGPAAPFG